MSESVCARCTKPIEGDRHKIGVYTYGECCIEWVNQLLARRVLANYDPRRPKS